MLGVIAVIAVACVSVAAITFLSLLVRGRDRTMERKEQEHTRERRDLINRIMYLSEKPWESPIPDYAPQEETVERMAIYAEQEPID